MIPLEAIEEGSHHIIVLQSVFWRVIKYTYYYNKYPFTHIKEYIAYKDYQPCN